MRDFVLDLVDSDGALMTPTEYLNSVLEELPKGRNRERAEGVRAALVRSFKHRKCFTLPRPVNVEADIVKLSQLDYSVIRDKFVAEVGPLKDEVFAASFKKGKGKFLYGKHLLKLLEAFLQDLNTNTVSNIPSNWQMILSEEYEEVLEQALDLVKGASSQLQKLFPLTEQEIVALFRKQRVKGEDLILSCPLRDETHIMDSLRELDEYTQQEYTRLTEQNCSLSREYNLGLIESLFNPVFSRLEDNFYKDDTERLEQDWSSALDQFELLAKPTAKYEAIAEFSKKNQDTRFAKHLAAIFAGMQQQLVALKLQSLLSENHLQKAQLYKTDNALPELRTELALNRIRINQLDSSVRHLQSKVLRLLAEKISAGEEELDVISVIETVAQDKTCACCLV